MRRQALLLVLALHSPTLPLAAQGLHYDGGLSVASGAYIFTERTTSWSLFTGLTLDQGRFTFRASLPVHLQNTTLVSLSGPGGGLPTGGPSSGTVSDSGAARKGHPGTGGVIHPSARAGRVEVPSTAVTGYEAAFGDPTGELAWRAIERDRTVLSVALMTKIPMADTATFGTGEWDIGSSAALSQALGRGGMLGLNLSYWRLGDLSTLDFRDPVYGSASFSYLGTNGWGGGLTVSAGTPSLDGYSGPVWVGGSVLRVSAGESWSVAGAAGLSETTPDFTLSLTWKVRLARL